MGLIPESITTLREETFSTIVIVSNVILYLPSLLIVLWANKKNYEVTTYKVYPDRIEFEEGFVNHRFSTVKVKDLKEIHYSQSFFQRQVGLGTVRLVTAANSCSTNWGIALVDIENSNYVYAKVKEVLENSQV